MKSNTRNLPKCKNCAIRANALFGSLETEQLDKARALRSSQMIFSAGEFLYHEGDVPPKAFTLYEGWVILFKNLSDGSRQILKFSLPGDFLCFNVGQNHKMDHSAIAVTDATLCAFPISGFRDIISEVPELAFAISSVNETSARRCHTSLTAIASHPAEAKIAFLLLNLFMRVQNLNEQDDWITFPITQEDVADALGLTAIHVNRVFQSLRKQGLIECKNRSLWIPDKTSLAKVAKISLAELEELI